MSAPIIVTNDQHADLLRAAFAQIHPPGDWKGPIDALVPYGTANLYHEAIRFMTGTTPTGCVVEHDRSQMYHLRSVGYRAGPAGP
jgi:hypothetical protein